MVALNPAPRSHLRGRRFGLDLLGAGHFFRSWRVNMHGTVTALREAMNTVDRQAALMPTMGHEPIPIAPFPSKEIERELCVMEICLRELATLTPEQRQRTLRWVSEVLDGTKQ
jgi:hypothetical protein